MSDFSKMVIDMEDEMGLKNVPVNMSTEEEYTLTLRRTRYLLAKEVGRLEAELEQAKPYADLMRRYIERKVQGKQCPGRYSVCKEYTGNAHNTKCMECWRQALVQMLENGEGWL